MAIRFCPYQLRFHYTNRVTELRDLYSETLIGTDKTWWWPWMAETCFDFDVNFQEYTSFISYELCYWLPSHLDIFTYTSGITLLNVKVIGVGFESVGNVKLYLVNRNKN